MAIQVEIPLVLRSFTSGQRSVQAEGIDLKQLMLDLDTRHRGREADCSPKRAGCGASSTSMSMTTTSGSAGRSTVASPTATS